MEDFEVFTSINIMHVIESSNHIDIIPIDMESLMKSGHKIEEIEEAEVAFCTLFNATMDLMSMLLESGPPRLEYETLGDLIFSKAPVREL